VVDGGLLFRLVVFMFMFTRGRKVFDW
jgi:hypothetical protein